MLTYPIPEEMMTRLKQAHERVKAHPYRERQVGPQKAYANALYALSEAFSEALYTRFLGERDAATRRRPGYDTPGRVVNFGGDLGHEFNTIIYYFHVSEGTPDLMLLVEKYIIQIHHFIDTGVWTEFLVWYVPHHWHPNDFVVEWVYIPERNDFEYTDDFLKKHGNWVMECYLKRDAWDPAQSERDICRYYYDRIKKLGVTLTVDVTALVKFMDGGGKKNG
jgi:hypothetical protein